MRRESFPITRDAFPYLLVLLLLAGIFYFIFLPLSIFFLILAGFVAFFFRNPRRTIPGDESLIVSPADGTVMEVSRVYEDSFLKGEAWKVSIFLSLFNVHLNRSPIAGEVKFRAYRPGKFLPAFKSHASEINEKNFVGIEKDGLRVLVTQITGLIARRIVCWVETGDRLEKGQLFGLIKFGSCTEIFLPLDVEITVKPKDKVKGGETVIGRIKK
ncbi:MAG: phosphatidylserine decarboxylase [Eubacteriales bacterium]|nr:phosphatidylserine decarboxylase [Eubacteriales bacterium]MDN5364390.1 phosphatidylserine decarboxylase [Eubacteriales bacterium]